MNSVSLVLATVGRSLELVRCLESIAAQTLRPCEVIIVDQNPDDRLVGVVAHGASLRLNVRHLRLPRPNLSVARNAGWRAATGSIVGFPDDDCWYEPETLELVGRRFTENGSTEGVVARWVEQSAALKRNVNSDTLRLCDWRRFRGGDASSISLFLRREALISIGGFDERLGVGQWFGAAEETDLLMRALSSGMRIERCPAARVHHEFSLNQPGDLAASWAQMRRRGRGTGAIYAKHRLPALVVARGFVGPVYTPLVRKLDVRAAVIGSGAVLGRIEGMLRWGWGRT